MQIARARVIDLHEREARIFPRSDLVDSHGQSRLLPETRQLSAVELREVVTGIELKALGLIGYLPLTAEIVLNLRPKFPLENLWAMLTISDETYDRLLPVLRSYQTSNVSAPHLLLAKAFCHYLEKILTVGAARGYYQEPYRGHFKPKVNFGRTVTNFLSRGDDVNVVSDTFTFSSNLLANRLVKSACVTFLRLIPRNASWDKERRLILDALRTLNNINSQPMQLGDEASSQSLPMWVRDAYDGALTVYGVMSGFTKIGFSYDAQGSEMPSFLFSLDRIFESFVRNTFRSSLRENSIAVLDGNASSNQHPLFVDNKRFPIKPDLIFKKGRTVLGIGEVKYKPKIEETDRYQVISHVIAIGAPVGIWISPATNGNVGLEYVGSVGAGAKFYHYRLDIGGNMALNCANMIREVLALFL
ncbi:McrC family protein [Herbaspirillum sp. SJZ099]|uniref:McrC family protein n=1 Tax=Herbaspirillum sp. SJZ099 TaxID=2572916 RepID=UPI0021079561|nr:McrC family protein [Herbaspirillum sp. SJZ099]